MSAHRHLHRLMEKVAARKRSPREITAGKKSPKNQARESTAAEKSPTNHARESTAANLLEAFVCFRWKV